MLFLIVGGFVAGLQSDVKALSREKVDKDQYCRDIKEIKESLKDIQDYVRRR